MYSPFSYVLFYSLQQVLSILFSLYLYVFVSGILLRNSVYPVEIMLELCIRFHHCWVAIEYMQIKSNIARTCIVDILQQCQCFDLTIISIDMQSVEEFNWIVVGNVHAIWNVILQSSQLRSFILTLTYLCLSVFNMEIISVSKSGTPDEIENNINE